eukprot:symbB.v1.2.012481.t1/scaffold861.1/size176854/11
MERRLSDRRSSSIHPASTSLLLKVEVPASGFDCLLNFAVKPGSPLEQVQQGITEVIDELAFRLASSLNEKDVQNNLDKYEVAKLECEQQLQDWQSRLSEATLAVLRADRSRSELTKLRESYWREVQNLRQQLYKKQQAKEHGKEFVPDSVDLFSSKEAANEFNDVLLQQMNRMEDEHQAEIAGWKQKNSELLKKMKAKVRGVEMETYDADVQTDDIDLKEASCQVGTEPTVTPVTVSSTSCQTFELEGVSVNNFVHPVKDLAGWVEMETDQEMFAGQKARTRSTEMTEHSYQDLDESADESDSDEGDEADEGDLDDLQPMSPMSPVLQDPITDSETQTDVDATDVSKAEIPSANPTLLGVTQTPTSPARRQRRCFHRPHLQVTTCDSLEHSDVERVKTFPQIPEMKEKTEKTEKTEKKEKLRINSAELEQKTHLSTPDCDESQRSSSYDLSGGLKKTKLPGLKSLKTLEAEARLRSPSHPQRSEDTKELTFPVCLSARSDRSDTASHASRPNQRTISRPKLSSRRFST